MKAAHTLRRAVPGASLAAVLFLLACSSAPQDEAAGPPFVREGRQCESGAVTEILPAGPYSYIAYTTAEGEPRWLASLALSDTPDLGSTADFVRYGKRQDFHSTRLDRDFPVLFFGHLGTC